MRTAFATTLARLAAADERIWLLTGDLGYSVLEPFARDFPARYLNVGVAEQNLAGIAAGLASCGKIVFTYSIANFPTIRCLEQIRNDICHQELPVRIVSVGGGYAYGPQGYTHHGLEDLAIMRALPGMTVVAPGDPVETELATCAIMDLPGPCYLRLGKAREPVVHATPPDFRIGRAIRLRDGCDATLINTGGMLPVVIDTAEQLANKHSMACRVLSMHTLKPLDADAVLAAARETAALVTVEEHSVIGGLGAAVAEVLAESGVPHGPFRRYGVADHVEHAIGSQAYLRERCGSLAECVRAACQDSPGCGGSAGAR
ncbi:MAG: transketolase C-terminal domain-containing protein [Planctomycetota bacterium]